MGLFDGYEDGFPSVPKYRQEESVEPDVIEECTNLLRGGVDVLGKVYLMGWYYGPGSPLMKIRMVTVQDIARQVITDGIDTMIYPACVSTIIEYPFACKGYNFLWQFRYKYFDLTENV